MEAPPPFLVILFLPPQLLRLCLHPSDAMTLLLHYWLVSSGDPYFSRTFLFAGYLSSRHSTLITNPGKRRVFNWNFSLMYFMNLLFWRKIYVMVVLGLLQCATCVQIILENDAVLWDVHSICRPSTECIGPPVYLVSAVLSAGYQGEELP